MSYSCEQERNCPGCGRAFICGMNAGWARCWCAELPPLPTQPEADKGCYCADCLKKRLAAEPVKPD
ncbi:MAG: cysteine-rich CWC family protein [Rhodocyclales bacterium]|nr:cysteine-rich CWC family protein [Rhodocyclales bacterium]